MAVIGKIRERSGLLLVIVGGAMAAFILTDLFSSRGAGRQDAVLGEVAGEEIGVADFERRVSDEVESYRNDFGQQVNAEMQEQVRSSVWNEMVKAKVMLPQVLDAGFSLSPDEYNDIRFGENILPDFRNQPNFRGPDGKPDPALLKQYFENVQLQAPMYHEIQKRRITENRLYAKYTTLVKKSVFVNTAQARDEYEAKNTRATFSFVAKRYDTEPDSLHEVSEQELRRFYDAHKNERKYAQKPSRKFVYVLFPVKPSEEDRLATMQELASLRQEMLSSDDDSLFIVANSDDRSYAKVPYTEGTADKVNDSLIVNAPVGDVVGPYAEGDVWKLVKVKELADVPEARVRHILLSTQQGRTEEEQKERADSILAVVKRDRKKFEELVTKFSDDPGSTSTGGVYEWFDKQRMVPEFTAASFDEPVGAITICKTTYGFHIVEVLGQRTRQERRVVSLSRSMRPSPATFKAVYKEANEFSLRNKTEEAMKAAAEEAGLTFNNVDELRPDQRFVSGIQDPGSTISWVNRAKLEAVSEPLEAGDNYVVALLTGIREEGVPALEDVRERFAREAAKEKKAEAFVAQMQGKTDLNALAAELKGSVQSASDMLYNTFSIPGGYSEYEVVGKIFSLENGQVSVPLRGDNAVYVVSMTNKQPAGDAADLATEKSSLLSRVQGRVETGVYNALKEAAGVKDNRSMFY
ncbi:MAG: peptidylprolyl isomerase [Flavobacteriales bacterium]